MGQIQVEKNAGGIEGLCVITPTVHGDSRGYFMETYNQKDMEEAGLTSGSVWSFQKKIKSSFISRKALHTDF